MSGIETAVQIFDLSASELADIDVLVVQNPSNVRPRDSLVDLRQERLSRYKLVLSS